MIELDFRFDLSRNIVCYCDSLFPFCCSLIDLFTECSFNLVKYEAACMGRRDEHFRIASLKSTVKNHLQNFILFYFDFFVVSRIFFTRIITKSSVNQLCLSKLGS